MQAKELDTATFGYDFRETSSSTHDSVVKKVKKSDVSANFDHQGARQDTYRAALFKHTLMEVHPVSPFRHISSEHYLGSLQVYICA